ncbi:hypothetical protein GCM10010272_54020 [Streptomyces lateritius]|nr:hypothetical protein GCM10010272_54020 [Streptomyces lateritius]
MRTIAVVGEQDADGRRTRGGFDHGSIKPQAPGTAGASGGCSQSSLRTGSTATARSTDRCCPSCSPDMRCDRTGFPHRGTHRRSRSRGCACMGWHPAVRGHRRAGSYLPPQVAELARKVAEVREDPQLATA